MVLLTRPSSGWARAAIAGANLAAVTFFLLSYGPHGVGFGPYHIDLDVYRIGGRAWLRGDYLYGRLPATRGGARLPFTYPPIAAVLLSPLSLVSMAVAGTIFTVGGVLLVAAVIRIFLPGPPPSSTDRRWAVAWLLPVALFLEPVRHTLLYGQINIVLMALVAVDCMASAPRWPRGALVGLAAAVKLTPAVFVLFFLLRRDYRAAAVSVVSFLAMTGLGFLLAWHDSVRYWTSVVFDIDRIGNVIYTSNQCVQAVLGRAGLDPRMPPGAAVWLLVSIIVVLAACRGMSDAFRASQDAWALSLNAFAGLLISPVSWSQMWVWVVPALLTLAGLGLRTRGRLAWIAFAAGLVVFATAAQWWLPSSKQRELHWAVWEQIVGSSYVIFAAVVVLVCAAARLATAPALPTGLASAAVPGVADVPSLGDLAGQAERVPGRIEQHPPAVRRWLRVRLARTEPDRLGLGRIQVVDRKVKVHLLGHLRIGPAWRGVARRPHGR
jgi:alpha-1,2-mannosyltransferase